MAKKREADVQFDFAEIDKKIAEHINDNAEQIAKQIARDAKASINEVTGNLSKGIRAVKSRYEDGGWIVVSRAPHSHLVEFGTSEVRQSPEGKVLYDPKTKTFFGRVVGPMPAKPFLRPALDRNIAAAKALFGVRD